MGELKAENWAAARELLERQPHRLIGSNRDGQLERFARYHAELGDRAFRLRTGLLEPDGPVAEAQRRYDRGEITTEQYGATVEAYLRRPPDEALFEEYYRNLWERTNALGRLLQTAVALLEADSEEVDPDAHEGEAAVHLAAVRCPSPLFSQELDAADRVAAETRIVLRMPSAEFGIHCGLFAAAVVREIGRALSESLVSAADGRVAAGKLEALVEECDRGAIPNLNRLRAMIREEHAAVKMLLRRRGEAAAKPPVPVVHINAAHCSVKAETSSSGAEGSDAHPEEAAPEKLKIPRWSEFGLGVHETGAFAFARAPEPGATVRLAEGVLLPLSGERWKTLFDLACTASDGRTMRRRELLPRLSSKPNPIKSYLKTTLSELRIQLASFLDGPGDIDSLLHDDGNTVDLGFTARALFEVEGSGGNLFTYGRRGRSG